MRLLADDVFVATLAVRHQAEQVAHGAARHEQPGFEAQTLRQSCLQAVDCRVFAIDIVAQLGARHGLAHPGAGQGHGVAAKVDDGHGGLLGSNERKVRS
ncbi:hypothetical protein D3C81_1857400 [compost metagenome]